MRHSRVLPRRRLARAPQSEARDDDIPPNDLDCPLDSAIPDDSLGAFAEFVESLSRSSLERFCDTFPYRSFLGYAEDHLDTEPGRLHLHCFSICSSAASFPVDLFCSALDLLFFLICLQRPEAEVRGDSLIIITNLCLGEPRLCNMLCSMGLLDYMREMPISWEVGRLVRVICAMRSSFARETIDLISMLLESADSALQRDGLKSFGILSLTCQPAVLSEKILENFVKFLDDGIVETFLEVLVFVHDVPPEFVQLLLELMRTTQSELVVMHCVHFFCVRGMDSAESSQFCQILIEKVHNVEYNCERAIVFALSKFYGVSGADDWFAVVLFTKFLADESMMGSCLPGIAQILWRETRPVDFLGEAVSDLVEGLGEVLEKGNEDEILMASELLALFE
jgi:hypothetical protein